MNKKNRWTLLPDDLPFPILFNARLQKGQIMFTPNFHINSNYLYINITCPIFNFNNSLHTMLIQILHMQGAIKFVVKKGTEPLCGQLLKQKAAGCRSS